MTQEEFIEWLDEEIDKAWKENDRESRKTEPDSTPYGRACALEEVKEMYLTVMPPPTTLN